LTWQPWDQQATPKPGRAEAEEAIRQMGTNVLPYLLRAVTNRDSALKTKIIELLGKQAHFRIPIPMAARHRREAEVAFHALGPAASNAVPELGQALNASDMDISGTAASALAGIGPEGWVALTRTLSNSNSWSTVCASWALGSHRASVPGTVAGLIGQVTNTTPGGSAALAEWALGEIGQDSEEVVPVLINSLQSSNASDVRWSAAEALGKFGTNARSAIPILLQALQDPDMSVRNNTKTSLKQIDPKAVNNTIDQ
jgi:HEAT repeat protein